MPDFFMKPKPVTIEGATYPSASAAARALGVAVSTIRYRTNPEVRKKQKELLRAYRADPEKKKQIKKNAARYYEENKEYMQNRERERRRAALGLPDPTRPCPSRCECCKKKSERALCLDHDHVTGEFRGWLCNTCNRGIGYLGDYLDGIKSAERYLRKYGR